MLLLSVSSDVHATGLYPLDGWRIACCLTHTYRTVLFSEFLLLFMVVNCTRRLVLVSFSSSSSSSVNSERRS